MQKGLVLLMVGIMTTTLFFNIGIVTEIFAQEIEEENSFSLSEQSIEEAQDNVTEITANKTGFEEDDTVGLSGRSIEEAQDNVTEITANKTGFEEEDTVGLSGRSIEEAKK